jgi:quercetin dioxygenase-like cupin family protein
MAVVINESNVAMEHYGEHVGRQRLITKARIPGTGILLDRLTLNAKSSAPIIVPRNSIAWFHILHGEVEFSSQDETRQLSNSNVVFLAPGISGTMGSMDKATVLYVEVPAATRFDKDLATRAPSTTVLDWTREPLLDSKFDSRKRIYLATPKLFGTRAIKAEMIIYPPDTSGSKHRHEEAEHFKYVLKGKGTGYADDDPHSLRSGDVVYHPAGEWHYSKTEGHQEVAFIEFFVPGVFKTVWASERVCTWMPSGTTIAGGIPAREIAQHSGKQGTPVDV